MTQGYVHEGTHWTRDADGISPPCACSSLDVVPSRTGKACGALGVSGKRTVCSEKLRGVACITVAADPVLVRQTRQPLIRSWRVRTALVGAREALYSTALVIVCFDWTGFAGS